MSSTLFQENQFYRPERSAHQIGYSWKGTPKMGLLYPIYMEELMPGDSIDINVYAKLRAMPMVNPVFADIEIRFDFWFDPYRLVWPSDEIDRITGEIPEDGWQGFITRSVDKGQADGAELADAVQWPRWKLHSRTFYHPTLANLNSSDSAVAAAEYDKYKVWQEANGIWLSLGLPPPFILENGTWKQQWRFATDPSSSQTTVFKETLAHDAPRRTYYRVWNWYYRDENLEEAVNWLESGNVIVGTPVDDALILNNLMPVHQDKNYFTSALPFQQRGTPPALPIQGFLPVIGSGPTNNPMVAYRGDGSGTQWAVSGTEGSDTSALPVGLDTFDKVPQTGYLYADLSSGTSFTATDMRFAFQVQKWLEKNARGGIRYHEFLMAHFGVRPADASLGQPEFIGTCTQKLRISEVLQTSESDVTPQGTMAGHGISVDNNYIGKYTAPEWGIVMGMMHIMPKTEYLGQGIPRFLTRQTAFDYPFPVFQGLSEQAVYQHEIYYTGDDEEDWKIFGYQGRFDECRHRTGVVTGELRDMKQSWTMYNVYTSAPRLNDRFIQGYNDMRPFAVKTEAPFIADVYIGNRAVRPITKEGIPGYVDHY